MSKRSCMRVSTVECAMWYQGRADIEINCTKHTTTACGRM